MTHLVYLCNEYPPYRHGGIGTFVQTMARGLVKRGWQVSVLGLYPVKKLLVEQDQGVNVHRLPAWYAGGFASLTNYFQLWRQVWQIHRTSPIEILEGNDLSFGLFPGPLPARELIRMQGGHHFFSRTLGLKRRLWPALIERLSFARAEHFCAVSRFAADITARLLDLNNQAIEILPNPVDTDLFHPLPQVAEQDGQIVFAGGLREKKGIFQLIQAMPKVVEKYPAARLLVYGADSVDRRTGKSVLETLRREITPELSQHVAFCGPVQNHELPAINAQASVLVYPSWMETQGIVVIEGMASGKAVVASQTGPGPELITDGEHGLLCDPYSPDSIAEKILLLLQNPDLRQELGRNARARAEREFSVDVLIQKNIDFYQRCLS